jgi:hypothetical protein
MFGIGVMRLMRESWTSAKELAEELFALLQSDIPLSHDAPLTLTNRNQPGQPALTVRDFSDGGLVQFVGSDGTPTGGLFIEGGELILQHQGALPTDIGEPTQPRTDAPDDEEAPTVFAGTAASGSGAGPYTIDLVGGGTVAATVLQILESETVPSGTGVIVVRQGDAFYFQPAVWM